MCRQLSNKSITCTTSVLFVLRHFSNDEKGPAIYFTCEMIVIKTWYCHGSPLRKSSILCSLTMNKPLCINAFLDSWHKHVSLVFGLFWDKANIHINPGEHAHRISIWQKSLFDRIWVDQIKCDTLCVFLTAKYLRKCSHLNLQGVLRSELSLKPLYCKQEPLDVSSLVSLLRKYESHCISLHTRPV